MMRIPFLGSKAETAIDPVCKMNVDVNNPSGGTHEHEGQTYYFCSSGCKATFEKDPGQFLGGQGADEHAGHHHM